MVDTEALLHLEQRRCAAIGTGDVETLKDILTDDYVHVHATGKIDDRAGHFDAITRRPRVPERGEISVRLYGDTAVLIGEQINKSADKTTVSVLTQVAIRREGRWRFVSIQVTRRA